MTSLAPLRAAILKSNLANETALLADLQSQAQLGEDFRAATHKRATAFVTDIRNDDAPGLMEVFLAEYGLSTDEGVALMCLAEALLRVPDADTIDALIEDKIAPSQWGQHLGQSSSSLVNASTWGLMLTGKVLQDPGQGIASVLHGAVKRLGEPVIRVAVSRAIKEMGGQFVLGETIAKAVTRGESQTEAGFTYSYDMLGEAAMTGPDAQTYFTHYSAAIDYLAGIANAGAVADNPGISVKLSALHPRYNVAQHGRVMAELVPRLRQLAIMARNANMGLNIDAEESERLDLSLDVIEAVLVAPELAGWDGFGVVVQAYGKRASTVIDWLYALAQKQDRKIMVRLVKGAYWDTEIKRAQVQGLTDYPVFTRKSATDVSYICCAQKLLGMRDRIYPQFATHNAHTVAAVLEMAPDGAGYEFQRLHGMGEALHAMVKSRHNTRCRIYAPVGAHRDLLAYLVRRLLENGANSSFVNQIVDTDVPAELVAADPFGDPGTSPLPLPRDILGPTRQNTLGWDLDDATDLAAIETARTRFKTHEWHVGPLMVQIPSTGTTEPIKNPADPNDTLGTVVMGNADWVNMATADARMWDAPVADRAATLNRAADLMMQDFGEIFAALAREAGKSLADAVAEIREAADFLRYYAVEAAKLTQPARGTIACISPWNFPLAIFTGQIAAALAAGNAVIAKPAETTPIAAWLATRILHRAGVPQAALQLLPGRGSIVGAALSENPAVDGFCFTGSTATAQRVNRTMAASLAPDAPLIAETGGLNAMIVDSTALPEQAVRDIVASAFQSAGQRCSALRVLYVQDVIADTVLPMLYGAMDELTMGDPWDLTTDVGPVISRDARRGIITQIENARAKGRVLHDVRAPSQGYFVAPTVIEIDTIADLKSEIFGPVLHVVRFKSRDLDRVIADINATGFGLTFGLHSRIDDRVDHITQNIHAGNLYINRNQIGAVVGVQPFGGHGLSGTGPKAGGPMYLPRFAQPGAANMPAPPNWVSLPGPTGESNRLGTLGRGNILCIGPGDAAIAEQTAAVAAAGATPVTTHADFAGIEAVVHWGSVAEQRQLRQTLADLPGALVALVTARDVAPFCQIERHICIDTTAAGGNAALLAEGS